MKHRTVGVEAVSCKVIWEYVHSLQFVVVALGVVIVAFVEAAEYVESMCALFRKIYKHSTRFDPHKESHVRQLTREFMDLWCTEVIAHTPDVAIADLKVEGPKYIKFTHSVKDHTIVIPPLTTCTLCVSIWLIV